MRFLLSRISLRWQLAALYVGCLSVALFVLGAALYAEVDHILESNVYDQLQADANRMIAAGELLALQAPPERAWNLPAPLRGAHAVAIDCSGPGPGCRPTAATAVPAPAPAPTPAPDPAAAAAAGAGDLSLDRFVATDVGVRFVDKSGAVLDQAGPSGLLGGIALPAAAEVALLDSRGQVVQRDEGRMPGRVKVLLEPAATRDGRQGVLELGTSLAQVDIFLSILRLSLLIGGVMALGGGAALGLAITRRLLQPLDRMAGVSWTVAGGDLSRRFTGPAGSREVLTLARNFNHMIDRLEASLRSQQRFSADAAHELRTPLTALGGNVELLLMGADEGDPQRVQKVLRGMDLEIQRLTRLVNDLLQLSRMEGQSQLQMAPVDVAALLEDVAAELRLVGPHALITARAEGALPVLGDRDKLKQVLLNIGDNALKFTPPGGTVTMTAARMGSVARLRIADSGPGIPPADLARIFDRFYRSDQSRSRASGGMGLGLAIAKAIVDAHRGTIVAGSVPGRGATFTIDLPLLPSAEPAAAPAAPAARPGKPALVNGLLASARRGRARDLSP